jgi:hypothetical protein
LLEMQVLTSVGHTFDEVDHVGVAIHKTNFGLHSGFVYRTGHGSTRILHLAFHHRLVDEEASSPFRWADISIDSDNKIVLSRLLALVAGTDSKIAYGFDSTGAAFNSSTGALVPPPIGKGMTCATFILVILAGYAYYPLDKTTWPERPEDTEWQANIIGLLEKVQAPREHIVGVLQDVGAKRIRPDEVVGAVTAPTEDWPLDFKSARALADQVLHDLEVGT